MRRLALIFAGGAVWLLLFALPVFADNGPHMQGAGATADTCAGCHRAHTAKAAKLLVDAQPALCYTCHGSTSTGAATDVQSGIAYTLTAGVRTTTVAGALRGGGFVNAWIKSASPSGQTNTYSNAAGIVPVLTAGAAVTSTHSVDGSNATAWGNGAFGSGAGATIQLRCGSCHDPHGNTQYRILRPIPTDSGGTSTPIADVVAPATRVYTTTNYWQVEDTNAPEYISKVSAWCSTCHTRYLAGSGAGNTSSTDLVFTYRHKSNDTAQGSANCIQCHVAHGSNAAMGTYSQAVKNPDGSAASPVTDSRLLRIDNRGVCQMCHNK